MPLEQSTYPCNFSEALYRARTHLHHILVSLQQASWYQGAKIINDLIKTLMYPMTYAAPLTLTNNFW